MFLQYILHTRIIVLYFLRLFSSNLMQILDLANVVIIYLKDCCPYLNGLDCTAGKQCVLIPCGLGYAFDYTKRTCEGKL